METIPDAVLLEIFSHLPSKAYLPTCHVSRRFRYLWDEMHLQGAMAAKIRGASDDGHNSCRAQRREAVGSFSSLSSSCARACACASCRTKTTKQKDHGHEDHLDDGGNDRCDAATTCCSRQTDPLEVGNLFLTTWNTSALPLNKNHNTLRTSLLEYYISCGWECAPTSKRVRLIMSGAAARGDIFGMNYLVERDLFRFACDDDGMELCTTAGAAGRLEALRWLREDQRCLWDPTEVFREASENLHHDIMSYVESNCDDEYVDDSPYGAGLPW